MAGVVDLISRHPGADPVHEVLINRSTLGATDASLFLASRLTSKWGWSLLGTGDWQDRRDLDSDGWADVAGYTRGVVRPRFYWDGGEGRTGFLTGGNHIRESGRLNTAGRGPARNRSAVPGSAGYPPVRSWRQLSIPIERPVRGHDTPGVLSAGARSSFWRSPRARPARNALRRGIGSRFLCAGTPGWPAWPLSGRLIPRATFLASRIDIRLPACSYGMTSPSRHGFLYRPARAPTSIASTEHSSVLASPPWCAGTDGRVASPEARDFSRRLPSPWKQKPRAWLGSACPNRSLRNAAGALPLISAAAWVPLPPPQRYSHPAYEIQFTWSD